MANEFNNLIESLNEYNTAILKKDKKLQSVVDKLVISQQEYSKLIFENYNKVFPLVLDNEIEEIEADKETDEVKNEDSLYDVIHDEVTKEDSLSNVGQTSINDTSEITDTELQNNENEENVTIEEASEIE